MSQIVHYDFVSDEFRVMTQEDWDNLYTGAHRIYEECIRLQALLREHGIPLPVGIKDRSEERLPGRVVR